MFKQPRPGTHDRLVDGGRGDLRCLQCLHTGSVNDYATYAVIGLLFSFAVIAVREMEKESVTNRICTVGHSTREFDEVLAMLRANDVSFLVDIRSFPSSKKFPQWNQAAIIEALPTDIGYRWIQKLGGRRHTPKGTPTPNGAWRVKAFRDYADHMMSDEFAEGLTELLELAEHERPAIMCSEAVPWRCHRGLVTDALIVAGVEVVDIMSTTVTRRAELHAHAHVEHGQLTYPGSDDAAG